MCQSGHCSTDPHSVHKMFVSSQSPNFLYVSLPSDLVTKSSLDRQISLGVWKNFQLKSGDLTKNGVSNDSSL